MDMFPGPFMFQSDGRNIPRELVDVADWLNQHGGHNTTFASDYRTSVLISGYTLAHAGASARHGDHTAGPHCPG